ncbi:uncharacterized protein RSE6_13412 [Rhynchosporium secalis]|uniref:FAS1 domain-containing protein n=1 Tax=Rhynchosporium secalis TaxID=38038 RepID=A0A1E1MSW3_RHYSE|nr:uncharacterized protein RSE6_13412 [Rhynchosporium secalis]
MKVPWIITLVPSTFAITLLQVLQTNPELSTLYGYVNASANATAFLASSNNFTFLAPSNNAISTLVKRKGNATLTGDLILASLQYGMLKGGYPTLSFSDASQYVHTNLANPGYSNVTGGQVLELTADEGGNAQVVSGNKTTSNVADELLCSGGIVHIIDKVLSIPDPAVLQISAAKMEYFVSILSTAGYLNTEKADYVDGIMRLPDVTYFIPNSAAALADATLKAGNSTAEELKAVFQYHVVPGFLGYSNVLKDGMSLQTQEGKNLTVTMQDGEIFVNSAKVVASDYVVANGVVHVIDSLLDRFNNSPPPKANKNSDLITSSSSLTNSSTTSDSAPAPKSFDTSSPDRKISSSQGLSTGTKIAVGVGVGVGSLLPLAVIIGFLIRKHKNENKWNKYKESDLISNTDSAPSEMESFYLHGGTIHKKDNGYATEYRVEKIDRHRMSIGPEIPIRSPGRALRREKSEHESYL